MTPEEEEVQASVEDFYETYNGHGYVEVIYTSSLSGDSWKLTTTNTWLVDETLHTDEPSQEDLDDLKMMCILRGEPITWE